MGFGGGRGGGGSWREVIVILLASSEPYSGGADRGLDHVRLCRQASNKERDQLNVMTGVALNADTGLGV